MQKLFFTLLLTLVLALNSPQFLQAAQSLEDQIKPYGIKMEDLQAAFDTPEEESAAITLSQCQNTVIPLGGLDYCLFKEQNTTQYAVTTNSDAAYWRVLQSLNNGILIAGDPNDIIMIEGKFDVIDGQQFSSKHYLLKRAGTFKYTNALGSTSTVLKLKLVKELKIN